jgi:hypothetical protein
MKLADLKPDQTISVKEAKELFEEIDLTHCIEQVIDKKQPLVHCTIQRKYFIEKLSDGTTKTRTKLTLIFFYVLYVILNYLSQN